MPKKGKGLNQFADLRWGMTRKRGKLDAHYVKSDAKKFSTSGYR